MQKPKRCCSNCGHKTIPQMLGKNAMCEITGNILPVEKIFDITDCRDFCNVVVAPLE